MKSDVQKKLHELAISRSTPFCYSCGKLALSEICKICGSDDLMRYLDGVGYEYGTYWIVDHILKKELTSIDTFFEESIRQLYSRETVVGWMRFDTVALMKSQDPISWKIARDKYISEIESLEKIITFDNGSNYYRVRDIEAITRVDPFVDGP